MVLNYASVLEEHDFFEESFKVYERGTALFRYPQVKELWLKYIDKFVERYQGKKMERLRDICEGSVQGLDGHELAAEMYIR